MGTSVIFSTVNKTVRYSGVVQYSENCLQALLERDFATVTLEIPSFCRTAVGIRLFSIKLKIDTSDPGERERDLRARIVEERKWTVRILVKERGEERLFFVIFFSGESNYSNT